MQDQAGFVHGAPSQTQIRSSYLYADNPRVFSLGDPVGVGGKFYKPVAIKDSDPPTTSFDDLLCFKNMKRRRDA